jgi:hypothetical protein
MRVESNKSQKQQTNTLTKHVVGEPSEIGGFGAFMRATLWELLAIAMVALATYMVVSLIVWLISLI